MIKAAEKYSRIVECGFQNRSAPYNISARDYIMSGKLGKIALIKAYCMLPGTNHGFIKKILRYLKASTGISGSDLHHWSHTM
jgi:predicted dehydrogenase